MESILQALDEVTGAYRDTRIHYCRLAMTAFDSACCVLTGAVLDEATLEDVIAGLAARFPGLTFDATRVRVLRPGASRAVVATNVAGLYAASSFLAEQVSQLLNGWPVEVLMEDGRWCFVRLSDGYLGWAYRPYLAETVAPAPVQAPVQAPTHVVCEPVSLLRAAPSAGAPVLNRVSGGTVVAAEMRSGGAEEQGSGGPGEREGAAYRWIRLAGDPATPLRPALAGWVPTADLRALAELPQDEAGRRARIVADAARFTGVPYLWGGCTAFGIDCSGFAQLLHRLVGVIIPRDADMQFDAGRPVAEPFQPGDLLFFGEGDGRKITHVGVSLGGWRILHSSRSRNGVQEDDVQAVEHLRESFVGARTFVGGDYSGWVQNRSILSGTERR
jgi:gamma-D-glutamyl-L-lysine dipeptidyl-peptidase